MDKQRKGIVLAGGSGTRLYPVTKAFCKQLLPIYDKPMIYYPLATLMRAGMRDICVISTPQDTPRLEKLLGDGEQWGINISYIVQDEPAGIAQAFPLARHFIGNDPSALILGDNLFYGHDMSKMMEVANERRTGASVFAYHVTNPKDYGVVEFDSMGAAISLAEKPSEPKSNYAITGLYFYDNKVIDIADNLQPSSRGELEITDLNQQYLDQQQLYVDVMGRGMTWLDTGTHDALLEAGTLVQEIEKRQGFKVLCPEEVAYRSGYIDADQLEALAAPLLKSGYGDYLMQILTDKVY